MSRSYLVFVLSVLASVTYARPRSTSCREFVHNITASAVNRASDGSAIPVNGTWPLSFRYCEPRIQRDALQILLHGASYDKTYWDFPSDLSPYSYVRFAADRGYATLTYDRLGSGDSPHPDPIIVVQAPLQIAIAEEVIALARSGHLLPDGRGYSRIIHVGHSFGSVITTGVLASSPSAIDIAVLTGYAHHPVPAEIAATAMLTPARDVDPTRFGSLDPGYLTTLNSTTRAAVFYDSPGTFSPRILRRDEATKGTFATGELSHNVSSAPDFTGHVGAFIGEHDILNCDAGCTNVPNEPTFFPAATYEYTIIPRSGHCLNLHYTAQLTFASVHRFLSQHGF
ncbi:alpha/beta-hydrolase [Exidia glandulosa HHB12029]|uniref:Alpha/beta-hydrolase n=1 Tax=Exidia glandulosa HHB12029 TaxID=1314781 RepID=A0A165IRD8_EXIGL|nr:alpha/beta-hydrolase [Exidia glandulosa HHB12029]